MIRSFVPLLLAAMVATTAQAADSYPSKPIRVLVPFAPGGVVDTSARILTNKIIEDKGWQFVVDNRPGANGFIATGTTARANADGYTVLMGANTMLMASQLYKNVPFDPLKDFAPVSLAAWGTLMLVANPATAIKSVQELVTRAKAKPDAINYGSPGIGTPHHMAMELFKTKTQLSMLHVPYRGTAGYTQDLLSGELMVGFLPVHIAQGFVTAGKLTALAVGSPKRHPVSPAVATFEELGVKGVEVDLWYAFFAPAKTPAPVIARLNTEVVSILKLPEIRDLLGRAGMDAAASTTEELGALSVKDYPRWGEVIRRNGITAE